ncbi:helix-turn-helix domain-containing protein [Halomontanus rarus]|uniref:helix-turn-helix domain-containing protein n=1 Tax=Halomontanus rarus TaxID=3034020 RepID=UPI0023E85835|nr:helix-turn-helix domain-containing protein [Halovivax sp. TS33]
MDFIAEIHVEHDDLALVPTIRSETDVTLRWEYDTTLEDGRSIRFFSVFGDVDRSFEAALEDDHTVSDPTCIATFAERRIYRAELVTDLRLVPSSLVESGVFVFRLVDDGPGWSIRLHLSDRDALLAFNRHCDANDISFRLTQLHQSDSIDDIATVGLSEQQRDLLLTVLYAGYYDIPRQATQKDIADRFDVSTSAISQRIRRAVAQLIVTTLEQDDRPSYDRD